MRDLKEATVTHQTKGSVGSLWDHRVPWLQLRLKDTSLALEKLAKQWSTHTNWVPPPKTNSWNPLKRPLRERKTSTLDTCFNKSWNTYSQKKHFLVDLFAMPRETYSKRNISSNHCAGYDCGPVSTMCLANPQKPADFWKGSAWYSTHSTFKENHG